MKAAADTQESDRTFILAVTGFAALTALGFLAYTLHLTPLVRIMAGNDFSIFYSAAQALAQGGIDSVYHSYSRVTDAADPTQYPFVYPPVMLFFLWLLGQLSFPLAATVWFCLQGGIWLLAIALLPREKLFPLMARWGRGRYGLVMLALTLPFGVMILLSGQAGLLTAALLISACAHMERCPVISGITLGLLIIKPPLALVLPVALVASRQWTTLATAAITTSILILASGMVWGWHGWVMFFDVIAEHSGLLAQQQGFILTMMAGVYGFLRSLPVSHVVALTGQVLCSGMAALAVWRSSRQPHDVALYPALLVTMALLADPYLFLYDLCPLCLALAVMADRGMRGLLSSFERLLFAIAAFLPLVLDEMNKSHIPIAPATFAGLGIAIYAGLKVEKQRP